VSGGGNSSQLEFRQTRSDCIWFVEAECIAGNVIPPGDIVNMFGCHCLTDIVYYKILVLLILMMFQGKI